MAGKPRRDSSRIGVLAESRALDLLQTSGLELIAKNFRCRYGEIDLIMREQATIVFIEVRHRSKAWYGTAADTIDRAKRRRLWRTAQYFLVSRGFASQPQCRFDVVTSDGADNADLCWFKAAFWYEE